MKFVLELYTKKGQELTELEIVEKTDFSSFTPAVNIFYEGKQIRKDKTGYENIAYLTDLVDASGVDGYKIANIEALDNEVYYYMGMCDTYACDDYIDIMYGGWTRELVWDLEGAMEDYCDADEYHQNDYSPLENLLNLNEESNVYEDLAENEYWNNEDFIRELREEQEEEDE